VGRGRAGGLLSATTRAACAALLAVSACDIDLSLPPRPAEEDRTPPAFTGREPQPAFATEGTLVRFSFTSSKDLPELAREPRPNPEVTFAGAEMSCTPLGADRRDFDCTLVVSRSLPAGPQGFTVVGRDGRGNESPVWPAPGFSVELDFDAPMLTTQVSGTTAELAQVLTFAVDSNEPLREPPAITSAFFATGAGCSGAAPPYSCTGRVSALTPLGPAVLAVRGVDRAGNAADAPPVTLQIVPAAGNPPVATFVAATPNPARPGVAVTLAFTADQPLTDCGASVAGVTADGCAPPLMGTACQCTFTVPPGMAEGSFAIDVRVGNASGQGSDTDTLYVDRTPPVTLGHDGGLVVVRHPVGVADGVTVPAGPLGRDDGGAAYPGRDVVAVAIYASSAAMTPLVTVWLDGGPQLDVPLPGTETAGPRSPVARVVDLAGNTASNFVALAGADVAGPVGVGAAMTFERRDLTQADFVWGDAGSFVDSSYLSSVELYDAADAGAGSGPVATDLGFAPIAVGTPASSYPVLWAVGVDKCGNRGARVPVANGQDLQPPQVAAASVQIVRRDLSQADGVSAASGAFTDNFTVSSVSVFAAASGGAAIATGVPTAAGGLAEVPVGTSQGAWYDAPCNVWVAARDKAGNASARAMVMAGADTSGPAVDSAALSVVRRDLTAPDGVVGAPGAFSDALGVRDLYVSRTASTVSPLASRPGPLPANGSFPELAFGTATSSLGAPFVGARDKCGNLSWAVPDAGLVTSGPTVNGNLLVIVRRPYGQLDGVFAMPGAVTDPWGVVDAGVHATAVSNARLAWPVVDALGGFAEVPVGDPDASYPALFVEAANKAGLRTRVEAMIGRATPPTLDANGVVIVRRGFTEHDTVLGLPGAYTSVCAAGPVYLCSAVSTCNAGSAFARAPAQPNGAFDETPIGTPTSAPSWVSAAVPDKCGLVSPTRVNVAGYDVALPFVDGRRATYLDRAHPAADGVWADAGLVVDAHPVRVELVSVAGVPLAAPIDLPDGGGFAEQSLGPGAWERVLMRVRDKAGHTVEAPVRTVEATYTLSGRAPYDTSASRLQLVAFSADVDPATVLSAYGMTLGRPVDAAALAAAAAMGGPVTQHTASSETASVPLAWAGAAALPSPRAGHAMAYDHRRGRLVVFGGRSAAGVLGDVWEHAGGAWQQAAIAGPNPPARENAALIYDPLRGVSVLVGGQQEDGGALRDSWEYDGVRWVQTGNASSGPWADVTGDFNWDDVAPSTYVYPSPLNNRPGFTYYAAPTDGGVSAVWTLPNVDVAFDAGYGFSMAHDPIRSVSVVFGGASRAFSIVRDHTELSSGSFVMGARPGAGLDRELAFDPVRRSIVLFGGSGAVACCGALYGDVWELPSTGPLAWSPASPGGSVAARMGHRMVWNPDSQRLVVVGGLTAAGFTGDVSELSSSSPHDRWAAHLFFVPKGLTATNSLSVTRAAVTWVGHGSGNSGGAMPGARIFLSYGGANVWSAIGTTTAASPAVVTNTLTSPGSFSPSGVWVLATSTYPSGPGVPSSISTDYFELQLTYSTP